MDSQSELDVRNLTRNRMISSRKRPQFSLMPSSNGHSSNGFRPPRNRVHLARLSHGVDTQPEICREPNNKINSVDFVKQFISNVLTLPSENETLNFKFDDLEELEFLGRGSFGVVRKMLHKPSKVEMAVKRIIITNNEHDEMFNKSMQRFRNEIETAQAASKCDEIVKYYGITFSEGDAWMCMELMDLSLDKLYLICHDIVKQSFKEEVLGVVAVATIRAVQHLKKKYGIIHRDIKPSNILLDRQGNVKLCDFGICGYLKNSVAQSVDVGCRPYMAPERILPNGEGYDIKSDVWSLGITLLEVANGKYPYEGFMKAPVLTQVRMIAFGDPPLLRRDLKLSLDLNTFIAYCTVKDKNSRASLSFLQDTNFYLNHCDYSHKPLVAAFVSEMYLHRDELTLPEY